MLYTIPLAAIPAQSLTCPIAGLQCQFWLRQLASGLYIDITANNTPLLLGTLCQNGTDLLRSPLSPLPGTLYFGDNAGTSDPDFTGLGSRFLLYYEDNSS
ncbi:phage baseplate plug family protein [Bombella pollinis]|uniref:Cyanophage baseplate Pam3 plug gp18 domain-containing protein n=1 Tax=Bombella pollinis TaxID=2967337 RepID=A0ABT3WK39_9PROT|nr:hypothetical protein [Bombella pollinis]MCX5619464.1 hypothetical protein [Bombella pollinis]